MEAMLAQLSFPVSENIGAIVAAALLILAVLLALAGKLLVARELSRLRAQGVYPPPGKATMDDVKRLVSSGRKILAIRAYREIHRVPLKEAKEAVEQLESGSKQFPL